MIATSMPCARTRPSPSTASANRATKETASSVRVSVLLFCFLPTPSTAFLFHLKALFFLFSLSKIQPKKQPLKHSFSAQERIKLSFFYVFSTATVQLWLNML